MAAPTESPDTGPIASVARSDHSPWNWLLVIPIVVPLLTPIYNHDSPRLWGFPAFYWLQLAFIFIGVATTSLVYQMTRSAKPGSSAAAADPAPGAPTPGTSPPDTPDPAARREDASDE